jgi:hypothetical protein
MPWIVTKLVLGSYSLNGTEYDGWITLTLFFACLIFALIPDIKHPMKPSFFWASFIAPLLAGIIVVSNLTTAKNNLDNIIGHLISQHIEVGIGVYVILVASVCLPISLLFTRNH